MCWSCKKKERLPFIFICCPKLTTLVGIRLKLTPKTREEGDIESNISSMAKKRWDLFLNLDKIV